MQYSKPVPIYSHLGIRKLSTDINYEAFWTDSQTALGCISDKDGIFKIFKANQVHIICDKKNHNNTIEPADNATTGLDLRNAVEIHRQFVDPAFLCKNVS